MLPRAATVGLGTKGMKLTRALAFALASLWVGNPLAWASPVLCSSVTSLRDWTASADACAEAEVRSSLIESMLLNTAGFAAAAILLPSGTVHIVFKDLCHDGVRTNAYAHVAALTSEYHIDHRRLHVVLDRVCNWRRDDGQEDSIAVDLASVDGAPTDLAGLPLDLSFLDVREIFVEQFGTIVQAANAYTQRDTSPVGEPVTSAVQVSGPASLILFGLGLLSMSLLRRKIAA